MLALGKAVSVLAVGAEAEVVQCRDGGTLLLLRVVGRVQGKDSSGAALLPCCSQGAFVSLLPPIAYKLAAFHFNSHISTTDIRHWPVVEQFSG